MNRHVTDLALSDKRATISGRALRRGPPVPRVLAGVAAHNGGLVVTGLSYRQTEKLTSIRRSLIAVVDKAGPEAIEALRKGEVSLSDLRAAAEQKSKPRRVSRYVNRVGVPAILGALSRLAHTNEDPAALAEIVLCIFGDAVCAAIFDKMTAPTSVAD